MKKEYYCRQKFLFAIDVDSVRMEDSSVSLPENAQHYTEQPNLFDGDSIQRFVYVSELDENIDTLQDFENLLNDIRFVSELVLIDDRQVIDNKIFTNFSERTIKSYLWWFKKFKIKCKYVK